MRRPRPNPQAALRLFCLPYTGGDASLFQHWPRALPADMQTTIEVCSLQLPGHDKRRRERPLASLSELLEVLVPPTIEHSPLYPYLDKPFALFGGSLGGLIGFELARYLRRRYGCVPLALWIAACRAPHLPDPYPFRCEESLDERVLIQRLQAHGGLTEKQAHNEHFLKRFLPQVRADVLLGNRYSYHPDEALDCPITVMGGTKDTLVSLADLAAWQTHTRQMFRCSTVPGDHFFVRKAAVAVLDYFCRDLLTVITHRQPVDRGEMREHHDATIVIE